MTTHTGSCHCGAVAFEVDLDLSRVLACNCSICTKTGALWAFTPATSLRLQKGSDTLASYQFGQKRLNHRHCSVCGVETFAEAKMPDGTDSRGINVRTLDGVDMDTLNLKKYDGRSK